MAPCVSSLSPYGAVIACLDAVLIVSPFVFEGGGGGGGGSGGGYSRSRVGRDKYGPPVRTEYRLVVENLSSRCSWQDLKVCM